MANGAAFPLWRFLWSQALRAWGKAFWKLLGRMRDFLDNKRCWGKCWERVSPSSSLSILVDFGGTANDTSGREQNWASNPDTEEDGRADAAALRAAQWHDAPSCTPTPIVAWLGRNRTSLQVALVGHELAARVQERKSTSSRSYHPESQPQTSHCPSHWAAEKHNRCYRGPKGHL